MTVLCDVEDIADVLSERIVTRWDDYGIQQANGSYTRAGKRLRRSDLEWHIMGSLTVGAYQIATTNAVKWILFDVDAHDGSNTDVQLALLKKTLTRQGVPFYDELSGSPGSHHLWVFMDEPTPVDVAYNWARHMVRSRSGYSMFRGEIFPKQSALTPDKPFGNLVKVPNGMNRRSHVWSTWIGDGIYGDEVRTVDLSDWEVRDIPDFRVGRSTQVVSGLSASPSAGTLAYGDVRPCLLQVVRMQPLMSHPLRRSIAMEYQAVSRMSETEIVQLFRSQPNFDHGRTLQQLRSLRGFNRPRCETIRECVEYLRCEGFDIDQTCQTCIARR